MPVLKNRKKTSAPNSQIRGDGGPRDGGGPDSYDGRANPRGGGVDNPKPAATGDARVVVTR